MPYKRSIKKFLLRFLIINVVYIFLKFIFEFDVDFSNPTELDYFYYFSTVFLFIVTWETSDWIIKRHTDLESNHNLSFLKGITILGISLVILLPISALLYYLELYVFKIQLYHFNFPEDPNHPAYDPGEIWFRFRLDFLRAAVIQLSSVVLNLFYHSLQRQKQIQHKLDLLEKEVTVSKYKSLKNQISPHFLFNSLNTLTSLMYEDRDLASDFVSRLASCYRYVLDNREEDLVSLEKELKFLDSFIFMMNIRHDGALHITTHISIHPENYVIPTLTLQMLVENALKHNYFSKEKPLELQIITINGQLLIQNTLRKRLPETDSTRLGIQNIKNRFSFYTNQEVSIEENDTYFKVIIPLLSKKIMSKILLSVS